MLGGSVAFKREHGDEEIGHRLCMRKIEPTYFTPRKLCKSPTDAGVGSGGIYVLAFYTIKLSRKVTKEEEKKKKKSWRDTNCLISQGEREHKNALIALRSYKADNSYGLPEMFEK